ncbi:hypothetical protein ELI15_38075 [Rhizobium ruizarguesonis]|uniref:hypothetical protein n=1 Tax=Rhizobium ruizarguesonis TaxID=2081791 RepID=UPI00102F9B51|nr:hypothetical protein [Rhizobium ruizarguesonis]TAW47897.1 hypothetical protein ELI15_38075 [Rhizobium ruizarguesonis]
MTWIFLTLMGAICIDLYQLPHSQYDGQPYLRPDMMASARVIADDVTVDEAGSGANRRKAAADGQNSDRHTLIELILPI